MRRPSVVPRGSLRAVDPSWLSVPIGLLAAGAVLVSAPVAGDAAAMLAITVFAIALWIGTPVPPWFTSLVVVGLVGTAFSTELALVGFHSAATWLVVFGLLIGLATRESGLATLVERIVLRRTPERARGDAVATYRYLLVALSAAALLFTVFVPSALVRVLVLGPILISIAEPFAERRPRMGLFLGPLIVTFFGSSGVLTGSVANIIIAGLVEANAGVTIGWTEWLAWMGPVMGLGRAAVIVLIADYLYRPGDEHAIEPVSVGDGRIAVAPEERRMLVFLLLGVVVWATDVVHGLHPLYGALLVALLAFSPGIGVVDVEDVSDVDFSIVFFLGAIFAIAEGLTETGVTAVLADVALSQLSASTSPAIVLAVVALTTLAMAFLMEGLAVASVLTPVLVRFAEGAAIPVVPVAMIEAVALSTFVFPYQTAVLVAILGLDFAEPVELVEMTTLVALATVVVLLPIQIGLFVLFY